MPSRRFPPLAALRSWRTRPALVALLAVTLALAGAAALPDRTTSGVSAGHAVSRPDPRAARATVAAPSPTEAATAPAGTGAEARTAAWRQALPQMGDGYLADVNDGGGAFAKRWAERGERPIRVWVAPGDSVPGWRETFATAVREAFGLWEAAGIPVRFAFLESADDAEVRVTWAERLPDQRAGLAHWTADADGWIERVHLEFATWVSDGTRANEASMRRIALHEIGHLLGLEHSQDPADVMAPWVIATAPTGRDHATARLLYKLPPGRLDPAWRAPMPGVAAGG